MKQSNTYLTIITCYLKGQAEKNREIKLSKLAFVKREAQLNETTQYSFHNPLVTCQAQLCETVIRSKYLSICYGDKGQAA